MTYIRETWCPTCLWVDTQEVDIEGDAVQPKLTCPSHTDTPDTLIIISQYPVAEERGVSQPLVLLR